MPVGPEKGIQIYVDKIVDTYSRYTTLTDEAGASLRSTLLKIMSSAMSTTSRTMRKSGLQIVAANNLGIPNENKAADASICHEVSVALSLKDAGDTDIDGIAPGNIESSITESGLVCLEDGTVHKILKRHLLSKHGLTPAAYRLKWKLPADYPMTAPAYSRRRSELAREMGLGRKTDSDEMSVDGPINARFSLEPSVDDVVPEKPAASKPAKSKLVTSGPEMSGLVISGSVATASDRQTPDVENSLDGQAVAPQRRSPEQPGGRQTSARQPSSKSPSHAQIFVQMQRQEPLGILEATEIDAANCPPANAQEELEKDGMTIDTYQAAQPVKESKQLPAARVEPEAAIPDPVLEAAMPPKAEEPVPKGDAVSAPTDDAETAPATAAPKRTTLKLAPWRAAKPVAEEAAPAVDTTPVNGLYGRPPSAPQSNDRDGTSAAVPTPPQNDPADSPRKGFHYPVHRYAR